MKSDQTKNRMLVALLLLLCFLLVYCLPGALHHCSSERCVICCAISFGKQLLALFVSVLIGTAIFGINPSVILRNGQDICRHCVNLTPITEKTKLLD